MKNDYVVEVCGNFAELRQQLIVFGILTIRNKDMGRFSVLNKQDTEPSPVLIIWSDKVWTLILKS